MDTFCTISNVFAQCGAWECRHFLFKMVLSYVAPSAEPRNVQLTPKSSTQLEITWEAPSLVHWNSEHLSYKVGYKYVNDNAA